MKNYRADFPQLQNNPKLIYLDSAATSLKPQVVIDAISNFYIHENAPIHRANCDLADLATGKYENARQAVANFIGNKNPQEIVFTKNATESLNIIANGLGDQISEGDEIIISEGEHHSNILPWQNLAQKTKALLVFVRLLETGEIDPIDFGLKISQKTKIISLSTVSNVFGYIQNLQALSSLSHERGIKPIWIIDASQSVARLPLVPLLNFADFIIFSGHKIYGPNGVGVLFGKSPILHKLQPLLYGGGMTLGIQNNNFELKDVPWRFEAGTPNPEGVIGMAEAIKYIQSIPFCEVESHYTALFNRSMSILKSIPEINIIGNPSPLGGLISFTHKTIHPHDLAELLNQNQICVRAGQQCASTIHAKLNISASLRISFGIYNNLEDLDTLERILCHTTTKQS